MCSEANKAGWWKSDGSGFDRVGDFRPGGQESLSKGACPETHKWMVRTSPPRKDLRGNPSQQGEQQKQRPVGSSTLCVSKDKR